MISTINIKNIGIIDDVSINLENGFNVLTKEIIGRLKKMEEELVIDRFEGNIAICENRKTGEIKEILKEELDEELKEGNIIKYENGKYVLDKEKQEEIEKRIKEKMDDIWNN